MEAVAQVPSSGTTLRINADRSFDGKAGDSVLRVSGEKPEGGPVFDALYVEVDAPEAQTVGKLLRQVRQPTPELLDAIAQEVQSTYGSKLSGRDAHQVAEICHHAWWDMLAKDLGLQEGERIERTERLAERFERAAAQRRQSPETTTGNGDPSRTTAAR